MKKRKEKNQNFIKKVQIQFKFQSKVQSKVQSNVYRMYLAWSRSQFIKTLQIPENQIMIRLLTVTSFIKEANHRN